MTVPDTGGPTRPACCCPGPGHTATSRPTASACTPRRPGTGRWCCCCTGSPSSGGPGAHQLDRARRGGLPRRRRRTCAATAPATSRRAATTCPRWPPTRPALVRALGETGRRRRRPRLGRPARLDDGRAAPAQRAAAGGARRWPTRAGCARLGDRPPGSGGRRPTRSRFQLPRLPERRLTRADDDPVADLMQPLGRPGVGRHPRLRRGRRPLPRGVPHPAGRLRRDGVLPLGRPLPAASRRAALRPPHGGARSPRPRCSCTARSTRACCPAPPAAPAATSPAPTSGGSCPASATSRTRRRPTTVTAAIAALGERRGTGTAPLQGPARAASERGPSLHYSQGPVPTAAAVAAGVAASATCGGQRVAGVRVVDGRGEHDAEHLPSVANSGPPELPARTLPYSA